MKMTLQLIKKKLAKINKTLINKIIILCKIIRIIWMKIIKICYLRIINKLILLSWIMIKFKLIVFLIEW